MTPEETLKITNWSEKKPVTRKDGKLKFVEVAEIPTGFWESWKLYKEQYKQTGITVGKYNGQWQIQRWSEFEEKTKDVKIELPEGLGLFPFQEDTLSFVLSKKGRCLISLDMGLGKSIISAVYMRINPEIRPTIIVCPSSVKINWQRELKKWCNEDSYVITGHSDPLDTNYCIYIINYDILDSYIDNILSINPKLIIWDECHKLKSSKTKRTKAAKKIAKGVECIIGLSGTPILNRPIEIFNILNMIRPDLFQSYWKFGQRYCDPQYDHFSKSKIKFIGATNTGELYKLLTDTCMIRREKKEVLKDLPDKIRTIIPIRLNDYKNYDNAENDFFEWLKKTKGEKKAEKAESTKLVQVEALKQIAAKEKLKHVTEWIDDFLENYEDEKLIIFCVHHFIIDRLFEKYNNDNIISVKLDGRDTQTKRQNAIDQFQNDKNTRIFIGNIKAAGEGITLTAASTVVFVEFGWTPGEHDQAEDRSYRIGTKNTVNIYYFIAENTIEEMIIEKLDSKRKIINAVIDGKETTKESLLQELYEELLLKAGLNDYD